MNDTESQFAPSDLSAADEHFPDSPSVTVLDKTSSRSHGRFDEFDGGLAQRRVQLTPLSDEDQCPSSIGNPRVDNEGHEGAILGDSALSVSREPQAATCGQGIYVPPVEDASTDRLSHQHELDRPGASHRSIGQATPSHVLSAGSGPDVSIRYGLETTEERAFLLRHFATTTGKW